MFYTAFTTEELSQDAPLSRNIGTLSGCSLKIENQSKFALDVFTGSTQFDRVNPYSFLVVPNGDYTVKVNKSIVSQQVQENDFVTYKEITGEVKTESGSTTFTGTTNVAGDMNVIGGQIDAYIQGDVKLAPDTQINANITGDVTLAAGTQVEATITGAVNVEGDISLAPGTKVEATIQNAQINSQVVNAKLGTNSLIKVGESGEMLAPSSELQVNHSFVFSDSGLYDTFVLSLKAYKILYDEEGTEYRYDIGIEDINGMTTFFNDIYTENTLVMGNKRTGEEAINGGSPRMIVNAKLPTEEAVDRVDVTVTLSDNWASAQGNDTGFLEFELYAFNSDNAVGTGGTPAVTKDTVSMFRVYYDDGTTQPAVLDKSAGYKVFPFNKVLYDNKTEYNLTTKEFIAKEEGVYQFDAQIREVTSVLGGVVRLGIYKNGEWSGFSMRLIPANTVNLTIKSEFPPIKVNAGDRIQFIYNFASDGTDTKIMPSSNDTFFQGLKLI